MEVSCTITTDEQLQGLITLQIYPTIFPLSAILKVKIPIAELDQPLPEILSYDSMKNARELCKFDVKDTYAYLYLGRDMDGNTSYPKTIEEFELWVQAYNVTQFTLGLDLIETEEI